LKEGDGLVEWMAQKDGELADAATRLQDAFLDYNKVSFILFHISAFCFYNVLISRPGTKLRI
jgi:hypothetical protein